MGPNNISDVRSELNEGLSLEGCRLYYRREGNPKAALRIVLLHAIGLDADSWDRLIPRLAERAAVVAVDLPGHGRSGKPPGADFAPLSQARRIVALLDELKWERAVLVGNSLGGGVSLATAILAPERVQALALLNTVGYRWGLPALGRLAFLPIATRLVGHAPTVAVKWGLESVRHRWGTVTPKRCRACENYLRSADGRHAFFRTLRQLYGPDLDRMGSHYGEIRCPTLLLHGESDRLIRIRHADRLATSIPGAELVRIPRCGHFPQEECPDAVAEPLLRFLGSLASE